MIFRNRHVIEKDKYTNISAIPRPAKYGIERETLKILAYTITVQTRNTSNNENNIFGDWPIEIEILLLKNIEASKMILPAPNTAVNVCEARSGYCRIQRDKLVKNIKIAV